MNKSSNKLTLFFLPTDLVPKRALMTPNRLCADINSQKIHATYMFIRQYLLITGFIQVIFSKKYIKIVLFTPGFGIKRGFVDRK